MNTAHFLSVQNIYCQIEIGGKGYPQQIGDLQIGCKRTHTPEKNYHCRNNRNQKQNPDKRKQISLHIKENNAPDEIHGKVYAVNGKSVASVIGL